MINSLIREAEILTNSDIPQDFGVDIEGPVAEEVATVEVPDTIPPLDGEDLQQFFDCIDTVVI